MPKLSDAALAAEMASLPDWRVQEGELVRQYAFADFRQAMTFVNRLAEEAEARQHHPDIDIRYNRVLLMLVTHDSGGITEKDTALAQEADRLATAG